MSSKDKGRILKDFMSITNCSKEDATQYLENADWNEQVAVSLYFESQTPDSPPRPTPQHKPSSTAKETKKSNDVTTKPDHTKLYDSDDDFLQSAIENSLHVKQAEKPPATVPPKPREFKSIISQKINTLDHNSKNDSSDDDDDNQGQAFYAGGSERSGQQILGPRKPPDNDKNISRIFDAARKQGATEHRDDSSSSNKKQEKPFIGAGYSLNDNTPKPSQTPNSSVTNKPVPSNKVERLPLRFYSNGFTVGDGELRKFEENKEFLDCIKRGEVPSELRNLNENGRQVEVQIEDHRGEEYKRAAPTFKPFGGTGHTVGLPVSGRTQSRSTGPSSTSSSITIDPTRLEQLAGKRLKSSSSSTTIRLRLPDFSTPISIPIDLNRTLGDVRKFLNENVPSLHENAFEFMEPPSTKIRREDERRKIGDVKLINTTLVVLRIA